MVSPHFVLGVTKVVLLQEQHGETKWYFLVSDDTAHCLNRPVLTKAVI
jgi:hypothetical protein